MDVWSTQILSPNRYAICATKKLSPTSHSHESLLTSFTEFSKSFYNLVIPFCSSFCQIHAGMENFHPICWTPFHADAPKSAHRCAKPGALLRRVHANCAELFTKEILLIFFAHNGKIFLTFISILENFDDHF